MRCFGEEHGESGGACRGKADAVKTVGNVHFDNVHGTMSGVGMTDGGQQARESSTELHGFWWSLPDGVRINARERQVHNQPWPPVALRHDPERGKPKVGERGGQTEREYRPETFFHKI
jgi:hypothetical protein